MKCPKCNFISFDYNDTCPKCGKDLIHERDLMDLPSYTPKPLSLLAPLNAYSNIPANTTKDGQLQLAKETMDEVPEELLMSLDDFSDDEHLPIQIESDPIQAEPGQKIDDETILNLRLPDSEETKSKKDASWDPEALDEITADMKFNDASERAPDLFEREENLGEAKGQEPMLELEIEPLEFDLELEEPDEKTS